MKKVLKIVLYLVILMIIITGAVFAWQYENISALISGMNNSQEDLQQKMDANRDELKSKIEKYVHEPIEDITAEDEKKLLKGEITVDEIAEKYSLPVDYMKDSSVNETKGENTNTSQVDDDKSIDNKSIDTIIGDSVSKMYALKAKYVVKLGEVERKVYEEYVNLPSDKQNKDNQYKIIMNNLDYIAELEKKCDNEVAVVLNDLEKSLKDANEDTEIISILNNAYKNEKEVKKAYYLSVYNN